MAVDFDEKESMFPSRFLTDEDINVSENQNIKKNGSGSSSSTESIQHWFSSCGSSDSPSSLSTSFGSELGSTETESDEDDFIAELTRQMADYMLQEDDENTSTPNSVSAKPEWSDCDMGSKTHHGQNLLSSTSRKPCSVPAHTKNPNAGFYSNDQSRAIQLENQQLIKQQGAVGWERRGKMTESTQQVQHQKQQYMMSRGRVCGFGNGGRVGPTPQQQAGSGMRAVFLGGSDSRSRPSGTGVFLPRGASNPPQESPKKRGCSTVLIPARVMQALKLHFDDMNALSRSSGSGAFTAPHLQSDAVMGRSNDMHSEQKRHAESQLRPAMNHQEMGLPQEWTY
ncbi:hypothetical protein F0562_022012 [Nyssa sinensis]|uniref:Uncharacterized protein n=1 Tax=Nyssa sinensis TaxID=561372 RepID=A0A5J5BRJ2_9ASTE|nr:hypothetical protein F0562_022012 [Nyssa sinensis]